MRPIDADALLKQLAEVTQRANNDAAYTGDRNSALTWDMAVEYIKNAPTIKIEQKKKGMWLHTGIGTICSNCHYKLETTGLLSHCPNCCAEMGEMI